MRLYLSSHRLGRHVERLKELVKEGGRVAVIENALDHLPMADRTAYRKTTHDIVSTFERLGFQPEEMDLRHYFGRPEALEGDLRKFDLIWACGGNVFLLRRAMRQSGLDKILPKLLEEDALAYGGWSAGICVLAPSLKGYDLCDQPQTLSEGYDAEVIWDGLGIVDFAIAPHYRSDHPEAASIEAIVAYFQEHAVPHRILRDGDVIFSSATEPRLLRLEEGQENPLDRDIGY